VVAELAFSRLVLESEDAKFKVRGSTEHPSSKVGGEVHGDVSGLQEPCALVPASIEALTTCSPALPLSPDYQPIMRRPKVNGMCCDDLMGSVQDSARFLAGESQGKNRGR
jgi:hypothetical protein